MIFGARLYGGFRRNEDSHIATGPHKGERFGRCKYDSLNNLPNAVDTTSGFGSGTKAEAAAIKEAKVRIFILVWVVVSFTQGNDHSIHTLLGMCLEQKLRCCRGETPKRKDARYLSCQK